MKIWITFIIGTFLVSAFLSHLQYYDFHVFVIYSEMTPFSNLIFSHKKLLIITFQMRYVSILGVSS